MKEVVLAVFELLKVTGDNERMFVRTILIATICYSFVAFLYLPSFQDNPLHISVLVAMGGSTLFTLFLYLPALNIAEKKLDFTHNLLIFSHVLTASVLYVVNMLCDINNLSLYLAVWQFTPLFTALLLFTMDSFITRIRKRDKKAQEEQNFRD